jgi:hypothetical protein
MSGNPGLLYTYANACPTYGQVTNVPPLVDDDAGAADAGGDGGDGGDAGTKPAKPRTVPAACDDLDVALEAMSKSDVWITRLRANLPNQALADTLTLEPSPTQEKFDNVHQTATSGTITASIAARRARWTAGTMTLIACTALILSRIVRRKRKS